MALIPKPSFYLRQPMKFKMCWAMPADSGLSVIPAGSGTKLGVGNPPEQVDLVLSTSRLDQVLEYEPADLTVTVEAGIQLAGAPSGS